MGLDRKILCLLGAGMMLSGILGTGCDRIAEGDPRLLYALPDTDLNHAGGLCWGPQGDKLIFHYQKNNQETEYYHLISFPEARLKAIPMEGVEDSQNFTPDGTCLLFSTGKTIIEYDWIQNQKREIRVSTPGDEGFLLGAVYSPDGREIAFCRGGQNVYIVSSSGGEAKRIASALNTAYWLRWSQDQKSLFLWLKDGPTTARLNFADGSLEKIDKGNAVWPIKNRPWIIYRHKRRLRLMDLNTGKAVRLSGEENVRDLAPSPDGKWVVYVQEWKGKMLLKYMALPENPFGEN